VSGFQNGDFDTVLEQDVSTAEAGDTSTDDADVLRRHSGRRGRVQWFGWHVGSEIFG
jgi:hypothetical protein